jgi:signal peptidase II
VAVLWITFFVVLFDQLTKLYIKGSPWSWLPFTGRPYGTSTKLIDDILRVTYIENPGIAFSINIPSAKVFFSIFSIIASLAILWYLKKNVAKLVLLERIALALILGGAVGNLIDRVFYGVFFHSAALFHGSVVDFMDFGYHANWWPVFNVADSSVTCGVTLLIALLLFKKQPKPDQNLDTVTIPRDVVDINNPIATSETTGDNAE